VFLNGLGCGMAAGPIWSGVSSSAPDAEQG
jgi:hypothetical protein